MGAFPSSPHDSVLSGIKVHITPQHDAGGERCQTLRGRAHTLVESEVETCFIPATRNVSHVCPLPDDKRHLPLAARRACECVSRVTLCGPTGPRRGVQTDGGARPEMGAAAGVRGAAPGDFFTILMDVEAKSTYHTTYRASLESSHSEICADRRAICEKRDRATPRARRAGSRQSIVGLG